jgi:hypothetical protein
MEIQEADKRIEKLKREVSRDRFIGARFLITESNQDHLTEKQKSIVTTIVNSLTILIDELKKTK